MSHAADLNLLFGILAVQMDFISRDQLVTAMNAWVLNKNKALGSILVEQKALKADRHALLQALVQEHVKQHGGDAQKSLAAVSSVASVKKDLERIADAGVQASLVHVAAAPRPGDPYATVAPPSVGAATSSGLRFRILRPHARGGLGQVYVARDQELHREVALKEIQDRHADHPESRSRFLLEAEITGGLEHPGIVPVYGLGQYGDGRPYYAMRFIRGDSLKEAIERFHKGKESGSQESGVRGQGSGGGEEAVERSLELRQLLGRFVDVCNAIAYAHSRGVLHRDLKPGNIMLGKYGETLVVDWGLAKSLDRPADFGISEEGTLTPASISSSTPTLAGSAVGTPQFMSPEQAAGRLEQLGPASDVYSLGATLYALLTGQPAFPDGDVGEILNKVQRGDFRPPRQVNRDVPPPLEAVCLKAMTVNPKDRYPSARMLADEIEHWLADEPVSAWKEPWTVRAGRWLRRHRTLATSAAVAITISVVVLGVATVLLTQANDRERLARQEAVQQKEAAEKNYKLARGAVDRYHTDVSENVLLHEPGMQPLRKKLLEAAREFYDQLVKERQQDPAAQSELGRAYFRLAQITGDIDSEKKAIELHQQALKILTATTQAHPDQHEYVKYQAECQHHLGRLFRLTGQTAKAEEAYRKAMELWEQLVRTHPKEDGFRAGQARSQLGLGNVSQLTRKLETSQEMYEKARATRTELVKAHANVTEYQRDLAVTHSNLAMVLAALGRSEKDVQACLQEAIGVQKILVRDSPNVSQYKNDLARSHFNLGDSRLRSGHAPGAASAYQEAAALWKDLVAVHPAVQDFRTNLAEAHGALSGVHGSLKEFDKAAAAAQEAVALKEHLAGKHPDIPTYQNDLARGHSTLADVHRAAGHSAQAETSYQEALRIFDKLANDHPGVLQYEGDRARALNNLGLAYLNDKQSDKAERTLQKARALWEQLHRAQPEVVEWALGLSRTCANLGNLARLAGDPKTALDCCTAAIEPLDKVRGEKQLTAPGKQALRQAHWKRAEILGQLSRHGDALRDWDRAVSLTSAGEQGWFRLQRAVALARTADHAQAAAEADALRQENAGTGEAFYQLACIYALSAAAVHDANPPPPDAQQLGDQYAARAMEMLSRARDLGFFQTRPNLERLTNDPDIGAMRGRDEFQRLFRDLGTGER